MRKKKNLHHPIIRSYLIIWSIFTATVLYSINSSAADNKNEFLDMVDLYGDFRFRFEDDWDSSRSSGALRSDRARARVRVRLGLKIKPNDNIEFGVRIRTGNSDSQQSPHITIKDFSNNGTGDKDILFDKWYGKVSGNNLWVWAGRNSIPLWKQNEMLWDDDVTLAGAAVGIKNINFGNGKLAVNAGYFTLPDGMEHFYGGMGIGQLVFSTKVKDIDFTAAGGLLVMDGSSSPTKGGLQSGNKARDYTIWVANLQGKMKLGDVPVKIGFDYMTNSEDYSATELAGTPTGTDADDTEGFDVFVHLGQQNSIGDWLVGYAYADIETLAVNSSFAQDDWMRWGSATDTRGSDFHGHEFRAAYVLPWKWKVLVRFYSVESNNNLEDGNRFRIDFNRKF